MAAGIGLAAVLAHGSCTGPWSTGPGGVDHDPAVLDTLLHEECVRCHAADYAATTAPAHQAAGLPTTCGVCHDTRAWRPATYDHKQFSLAGKHAPYARTCAACHRAPGDFAKFSCATADCHPADRMSARHREVGGYSYDDARCLSCHPQGLAEGD